MILYIAEKPSVGRALAAALPGQKKRDREEYKDDFIRCGSDVIVGWAAGHLLELYYPQDYDPKLKKWHLEDLPIIPDVWKLKEIDNPQSKKLLKDIGRLLKTVDEVVNVGDADREGQVLIDEILEYYNWQGPTKRLRINDLNPDAIKKALGCMKDNREYRGEYQAGRARSQADWLFGMNLTRYCSVSLSAAGYDSGDKVFSVGRVQTPTLALVVNKDNEIMNFVSKPFFVLCGTLKLANGNRQVIGKWQPTDNSPVDEEKRLVDLEVCESLLEKLENAEGVITASDKKVITQTPPLLWSLPRLQAAAAKMYDITNTQEITQTLYEQAYITYPRTDCSYAPEGHHGEAEKIIEAIMIACPELAALRGELDLSRKSASWNDSKITEHHAIMPTAKVPAPGSLSSDELKIYKLIAVQFVSQFMPECEIEDYTIEFKAAGERFKANSREIINPGWRKIEANDSTDEDEESEQKQKLPVVAVTETGVVTPFTKEQKTKPPKRFTYDTLLGAMNSIHLYVKDPEIRKQLKELDGIGTAATQENILKLLFDRGYLVKKKKQILSTDKGKTLITVLSGGKTISFVTPDKTALWEKDMTRIEKGELSFSEFQNEMYNELREMIGVPLAIPEDLNMEKAPKCPREGCDGYLKKKNGKNGEFFSCIKCEANFQIGKDGKPVPKREQPGEILESDCPLGCGRKAKRYMGQYGYFWKCECSPKTYFKDVDGKPQIKEQKETAPCPVRGCKGTAMRLRSKSDGRLFWKCNKCQNFFDDVDGKPCIRQGAQKKTRTRN